MVKLRRTSHRSSLNELNRLIWLGFLLVVLGTATVLIATKFFNEPLLTRKNLMLIALLGILLIYYVCRLVSISRKQFKSTNKHGNQQE